MRTDRHLLSLHLEIEWRALHARPDAVDRARSWGVTDVAFTDLDELLRLAGFGATSTASGNEVLRRLARLGRHDELAARVVLQRVLPGLLAAVARRRRSPDGAFEELVGAAWVTIRASRTPWDHEQVAANIVRDAAYRAFTAPFRRRSASEIAVDPHTLDETPAVCEISAGEELATAARRGPGRGGRHHRLRPRARPRRRRVARPAGGAAPGHAAHGSQPPRPGHRAAAPGGVRRGVSVSRTRVAACRGRPRSPPGPAPW